MTRLIEELRARALPLGQRAAAEMYQNPFWQDRFGARGREMTQKDGQFHLSYLIQALAADDPSVLTAYSRWLQSLLVSRGMCTRHVDENFERLARAIAELVPESEPACEMLHAARQALIYPGGIARELQLLSDALAEKVVDDVWSRQPGWFAAASSYTSLASFESVTQAERARWTGDVLDLLSYLADALQADRAELFAAHVVWMRGFFARRHAPRARLEETLYALAECMPVTSEAARPDAHGTALQPSPVTRRRASRRPPAPRPTLSEPPPVPVPLPMSAELAARAGELLDAALEWLARDQREPAAPRTAGGTGA